MRVSQLRPGMRGYALTVFHGTKIERFGIEILGIIKKYNEGQDYILFRATSGPSVTQHLNIAHGMSGSPIYINGKMVGAISMEVSNGTQGPSFGRDPIGLATPIEEMFDAWSPDLPSKPNEISAGPVTAARASGYDALNFQTIDLPVTVSGVTPSGLARLNAAFAPYHLRLMAGGGGGHRGGQKSDQGRGGASAGRGGGRLADAGRHGLHGHRDGDVPGREPGAAVRPPVL